MGFLTFGVVSEQIKTRLEVAADERGTRVRQHNTPIHACWLLMPAKMHRKLARPFRLVRMLQDVEGAQEVVLPSGVHFTDLRIGGGQLAARGLLVILDLKLYADGELIQVCLPSCCTALPGVSPDWSRAIGLLIPEHTSNVGLCHPGH